MTPTFSLILLVLAVVLFGVSAGLPVPYDAYRLRLVAAGLASWAVSQLRL